MHKIHGSILTTSGFNDKLKRLPEVFAAENFECVPVQIDGKFYWVVTDWMDNHYANIQDPNDTPDGTLDPLEVKVKSGVESIEDLLYVLPTE